MIFSLFLALGPELQLHSMSGDLGLPNCDEGDSMAINMALQGIQYDQFGYTQSHSI